MERDFYTYPIPGLPTPRLMATETLKQVCWKPSHMSHGPKTGAERSGYRPVHIGEGWRDNETGEQKIREQCLGVRVPVWMMGSIISSQLPRRILDGPRTSEKPGR